MLERADKGRQGIRHKLAYNNDSSFFWYFEPSMGAEALVTELVGMLRGTRVDTLIARIDRGNLVPLYDSKIEGPVGKGVTLFGNEVYWRHTAYLRSLFDAGIDPWELVFREARASGMAAFAGIRMNDLHHTKPKRRNTGLLEMFVSDVSKNPDYFIGEDCQPPRSDNGAYAAEALPDFAHEEVREHRFAIIQEMIERYDLDGIELDFQRHGFFFRESQIAQGIPLMTHLIKRIRGVFDDFEQRRGHPICLMVRVPSWIERCREIGLDVQTWVRDGLVDIVVPSSQADTEFDAPIAPFVELARGTPCEVLPTFELLMPVPYRFYSPAMARAGAANYYQQGADGIHLFNHHFFTMPYADHSDGDIQVMRRSEHKVLYSELHDPKTLQFRSKRYWISRKTTRQWPTWDRQLPVRLQRQPMADSPVVITIRVADDLPLGQKLGLLQNVKLSLRVGGLTEEDTLVVSFNGIQLDNDHLKILHGTPGHGIAGLKHLLRYTLAPDSVKLGENQVAVSLTQAPAIKSSVEVIDVEVAVNYHDVPIGV